MKILFIFLFLAANFISFAQQQSLNIIPEPASVEITDGNFSINQKTLIVGVDAKTINSINFLNNYLLKFYSF